MHHTGVLFMLDEYVQHLVDLQVLTPVLLDSVSEFQLGVGYLCALVIEWSFRIEGLYHSLEELALIFAFF